MLVGYLTVKETAEKWGINPRTVQTMCNDGRIPENKEIWQGMGYSSRRNKAN